MFSRKIAAGLAAAFLILAIVFCISYFTANRQKNDWAAIYQKNLEYNFNEPAVNRKVTWEEWKTLSSGLFDCKYDFDGDGQAEQVRISFRTDENVQMAEIFVDESEGLQIPVHTGNASWVFTVVGLKYAGHTYLAAVESVYDIGDGMGELNCIIYQYGKEGFVKAADISYSGTIGSRGMMVEGVLASNCNDRIFSYDVLEQQNDYIYQRSVVFADMKEMGIKFPFETVGKFQTAYKRNVAGIFSVIVK